MAGPPHPEWQKWEQTVKASGLRERRVRIFRTIPAGALMDIHDRAGGIMKIFSKKKRKCDLESNN
jgi:hypothetical protein